MKKITLILTGSIASIKYFRIINLLTSKYKVTVIYTKSAQMFINQHEIINYVDSVYSDEFSIDELKNITHINLAKETDLLLIAPCSYDYLNKIAMGVADSFSLSMIAAIDKNKMMIAPAMNTNMYENQILQKNIITLKEYGIKFINPDVGLLSCGDIGVGKLAKIKDIGISVDTYFNLTSKKIIITGGSTKLYIDPVRYITNNSSGSFSKFLVKSALEKNFEVHYIHGEDVDVSMICDYVHLYKVVTNEDLIKAIDDISDPDAIIMNIAPVDYDYQMSDAKIKDKELSLNLKKGTDIIKNVKNTYKVGFALETDNHYQNGSSKLEAKNLDMIIVNDAKTMGSKYVHSGVIINKKTTIKIDKMEKKSVSEMIIDSIIQELDQ